MLRLFKNGLRWAAYTVFLVGALVLFVYLTLPMDEIRAYLVRKAADEHQLALDITELKVAGFGGVELRGVTITPLPTTEEREAIAKARDARKQWQEAQAAAEADSKREGKGEDGKAAAKPKAEADDGADAEDPAGEAVGDGKGRKLPQPKEDAKAGAAAAKAPAAEGPPPVPPGPTPIFVERLKAKVKPLRLMRGLVIGEVDAELMGGHLALTVSQTPDTLKIDGRWEGLSIEQIPFAPKRKKIVVEDKARPGISEQPQLDVALVGGLEGEVNLEIPLARGSRPELSKITGVLVMRVVNAVLGPGQIFSREMGFFDLPRVAIQSLGGKLVFEKRKANFEDFKLTGKDIEGDLEGYVQLADSLKAWGPRAHLRFRFSEEFLKTNKDVGTALKGLPKIRQATDADGYLGLQLTGTVGDIKSRMTKTSVYRRRSATRPARPAAGTTKPTTGPKPVPARPTAPTVGPRFADPGTTTTKAPPVRIAPTTEKPADVEAQPVEEPEVVEEVVEEPEPEEGSGGVGGGDAEEDPEKPEDPVE